MELKIVGIRDFANAAGDVPTVRRDLRDRVIFYSGEISLISESESLSGQPRLSESRKFFFDIFQI